MFDGRTNLAAQVADEVRRHYPQTFNTVIPRSVRLSEAPSHGTSILAYAPSSRGARAYEMLAHELMDRLGWPRTTVPEPVVAARTNGRQRIQPVGKHAATARKSDARKPVAPSRRAATKVEAPRRTTVTAKVVAPPRKTAAAKVVAPSRKAAAVKVATPSRKTAAAKTVAQTRKAASGKPAARRRAVATSGRNASARTPVPARRTS